MKPPLPPDDQSNRVTYRMPWSASLVLVTFAWIPIAMVSQYTTPWTLTVTVPALAAMSMLLWSHQRHLPGVRSWWR